MVTERIVAHALSISPKNVRIVRGLHLPDKSLVVEGVRDAEVLRKLRAGHSRPVSV